MKLLFAAIAIAVPAMCTAAQVPLDTQVHILRAEDARAYGPPLETLMVSPNADVRVRAALAAGRIGDERSVPALAKLLGDASPKVREMGAFALGETESIKAADAIIGVLRNVNAPAGLRARAVEAAGKIAAANSKDEHSLLREALGSSIVGVLEAEHGNAAQDRDVVLLGITAVLRTRAKGGESATAKFLTSSDPRVRADAANALSRLRSKTANGTLRKMLATDTDPIARANAARALGSAEDKDAFATLLKAATADADARVRVSAIRALGSLKNREAGRGLLTRGEKLLADFKRSRAANPAEKSELLEIASVLGRLMPDSADAEAVKFLSAVREADKYRSPETEIAFAQVSPVGYLASTPFKESKSMMFGMMGNPAVAFVYPHAVGNFAQGLAAVADNKSAPKELIEKAGKEAAFLAAVAEAGIVLGNADALAAGETSKRPPDPDSAAAAKDFARIKRGLINGFPDVLRALAKLKPERYQTTIAGFLMNKPVVVAPGSDGRLYAVTMDVSESEKRERPFYLLHQDPIVRATAAELMAEMPDVNSGAALAEAYDYAAAHDIEMNDAQLAILDAASKQNMSSVKRIYANALASPDALVRQRAGQIVRQNEELKKAFPDALSAPTIVRPYERANKTKVGQVLATDADYRRALSRRNGTVSAVLNTEKGSFTIEFFPEDAPLTVDNFVRLARSKYFDGVEVHRVVPNFVMQDGDPRGDGNGGPGWSIRCEINMVPFDRGAVGMALSGKDTGGSQWFVTHSPQPHLDGGYTVFGRVNESGMKVVDNIVRGDKIISVRIVEGRGAARGRPRS